jgi:apolipoprotein N-acyltransferase
VPGSGDSRPFLIGNLKMGAVICSELMNPLVYHARAANAHIMLNAASESWIESAVLEGLILQATKARVLESRKPLLRTANVGYAGYVHIDAEVSSFTALHQKWHVPAYEGATPYTRLMRWLYAQR